MNKKVLLVNPDYFEDVYGKSKQRAVIPRGIPTLGLACLAAPLIKAGHNIVILDLNLSDNPKEALLKRLREFKPDVVGLTATTAVAHKIVDIAKAVKEVIPSALIVAGGPHPTALPEELLQKSLIDVIVSGEGDKTFQSIIESQPLSQIPDIYYRNGTEVVHSFAPKQMIEDLDSLEFPAYSLCDIQKYTASKVFARKSPLAFMETSRGCYARCVYCNKNIHGYKLRQKSPARVVDEMEYLLRLGFREIHIMDDVFTADMKRAYQICEEILKRGLKFPWYPRGGIRVDRVNRELLKIMAKSGCYRVPFGIESGSQRVIEAIKKKITLSQAENAVKLSKEAGLEVECYFMVGLPTETEEDILRSLDFAKKLDPDYVKFAVTLPFPGSEMFDRMASEGRIKSFHWPDYNFAAPRSVYEHDNLSWDRIEYFYAKCHRDFYFRPGYIIKSIYKSIKSGQIIARAKAFLETKWF